MEATKEIKVTQRDILTATKRRKRQGKKWDMCLNCVVGVAAQRVFKTKQVSCGLSTLVVRGELFVMPVAAEQQIKRFVHGKRVTPFSFSVNSML